MDKIKSMTQKTYSAKYSNINVYSTCKFWFEFVESFPFNAKFHTQNKNTQKYIAKPSKPPSAYSSS